MGKLKLMDQAVKAYADWRATERRKQEAALREALKGRLGVSPRRARVRWETFRCGEFHELELPVAEVDGDGGVCLAWCDGLFLVPRQQRCFPAGAGENPQEVLMFHLRRYPVEDLPSLGRWLAKGACGYSEVAG